MPLNPTYSAGTASVASGGTVVTGSGTLWLVAGVQAGDIFERAGLTATIASVTSNTSLTLARPWPGGVASGSAYEIRYTPDATRVLASARQVVELLDGGTLPALADLPSEANMLPYFTGPGVADVTPLSSVGRAILAQTTPQAVREQLGLAGYAGAGVRIQGVVANTGALPATANTIGDAYLVGSNLYVWSGTAPWVNAGAIGGPRGPEGIIALTVSGGTSNAIEAAIVDPANGSAFVGNLLFRITLTSVNTATDPSITVNGTTRRLRGSQLEVLTPGQLVSGTYIFETVGAQFARIISAPVLPWQLSAVEDAAEAYADQRVVILEDAPLLSDGSRTLMQFGGRDIMRMTPSGPRLAGQAGSVQAPSGGWAPTENGEGEVEYTAQAARRGIHAVDRFRDAGGYRYPTALVDGVARKAIIFSVYGQSNADATEMTDPLVWPAPPMPNHILMLNDVSGARGGLRGYLGVTAPASSSLIPAREDAVVVNGSLVQSYATSAAALLNHLRGHPYKVFAVRSHAVGGHPLVGSNTTTGIWKNSAGNYLPQWNNWTQDVRNMRDSLIALGYEIEAVHICFTHQEADWQTDRALYVTQFQGMKAEREAILAADLPGIPVRWFVDQASGSGLRSGTFLGGAWPSRLAIVDIAESSSYSNLTMTMPRYTMEFGFNAGALEDIHHSHYSRILQGEAYGHAMREIMEGRGWRCPRMNSATVAGNAIIVDFNSLLPIKIDPTFCKVRQDMGFKIGDGTISVLSVAQTGQRQLTIQCSASPAGRLLAYAWREQDAQDVSDKWPISTGAIRDAWEAPSVFLPGKRILRPALGYTLQL